MVLKHNFIIIADWLQLREQIPWIYFMEPQVLGDAALEKQDKT